MPGFDLDPDIAAFVTRTNAFYPPETNEADAATNRRIYDRMCAAFRAPRPSGVTVRDERIAAEQPPRALALRRYACADMRSAVVLLYLHGGGFVVGGIESHDDICAELCAGAGVAAAALDYRLAPEHPYPAALDDAEAAYEALAATGARLVLAGDSAGGTLAAALSHRLRRKRRAMPLGQVLIYPGLGGDLSHARARGLAEAPMLGVADCLRYRALYAGGAEAVPDADPEFAPLRAEDFSALPPAAIFAAGIDPLAPDAEAYAAALAAAGVPVTLRRDPGLVHAHLRARHASALAASCFAAIVEAVAALAAGAGPAPG